ncbi:tyrosine-type recombinase/integrase [uncultured Thiocystis sp.]|jgi:integrase|uniref:tyrosine-type recombinase/integrase n=1 Tax=uncultured Thiocystis sp. TaxID=1202134 RepID=UPI0025D0F251|nr:tyrosine-type recombinase/integrase [uncultured Thiocystis sp.]
MKSHFYTEKQAKAERWEGKDRLVCLGDGLYLNVRRSSKTWLTRRTIRGTLQVRTLGAFPELSVKAARTQALVAKQEREPSNLTVAQLAENFYRDVIAREHRRPHFFRGYLDRAVLPDLGTRRAGTVTPSDIAACVQRYRTRGTRSADQLRSVLTAIFGFAVETGVRVDNPAALLTRRVSGYRPESRRRVLTDDEIRRVWHAPSVNARLIRFLLLTGLRISEAQRGHRDGPRWIVPAALAKNGRAHWVHLTPGALEQLPLPACTATNVQAWLRRWCDGQGIDPRFTPHDLRRTAATRLADAAVAPFIVERLLNHTLPGVMAVYNQAEYAEERIAAGETLAQVLLAVVEAV